MLMGDVHKGGLPRSWGCLWGGGAHGGAPTHWALRVDVLQGAQGMGSMRGSLLGYPMGWRAPICWGPPHRVTPPHRGPPHRVTPGVGVPRLVEVPPWDVPTGQGAPSTHLLQRGVLDSVGIVVIVDDLKVGDCWARPRPHKPHIQGGLPCPPCLHTEMGGGPHLHPCNTSSSHCRAHSTQKSPPPPLPPGVSHCSTHSTHNICPTAPITCTPCPHQPLTCPAEPWSLSFDLGGIVGWVHLDAEGAGGDLLGTKTRAQ